MSYRFYICKTFSNSYLVLSSFFLPFSSSLSFFIQLHSAEERCKEVEARARELEKQECYSVFSCKIFVSYLLFFEWLILLKCLATFDLFHLKCFYSMNHFC
ncbi:hypothetical protein ERO13_A06G125602v2 [Gossypium hirsutum]|nr:hypothetical protein ERO13_A06G125602v2 [Gossypium hirsutum]